MDNYPSPCVKCEHNNGGSCSKYKSCQPWLTRYRYRQKQINAYAKKVMPEYEAKLKEKQEKIALLNKLLDAVENL